MKVKKRKREEDVSSEESDDNDDDEEDEIGSEGIQTSDESESETEDELLEEDQDKGAHDPLASSDEEDTEEDQDTDHDEDEDELSDDSSEDSEEETQAEKDKKAEYFESLDPSAPEDNNASFLTMNLSRPIVKAVAALGFQKPTPIQAATIPVALLGKDVVGNAVTGSGKTAAFTIPMLERLLYRDKGKKAAATRCLVLVPTRELAVQCFEMGTKLAMHTDVRFCLIVGRNTFLFRPLINIDSGKRWSLCQISGSRSSESP
jgi:ATP-dependent RNA helicase DDX27